MARQSKSKPQTTELQLPRLRRDQWEIATHPAKIKVICMGRRWGKTMMAGAITLAAAAKAGHDVAWIAPTYKNTRPLWRFVEARVLPLQDAGVTVNKAEREVRFPSGGSVTLYSADNIAGILGNAFHLVVIDEAARVSAEAWQDAIQPTLADHAGDALLISTPKGRNWFYNEWVAARADGKHAAAWQAPTNANPNPNIKAAFEMARTRVPERTFRQEWLAEFVEDAGLVFRRVRDCATAQRQERAQEGHSYLFGVDWGKTNDYTVIGVLDEKTRELVYMDRFNQIDYAVQRGRLRALYDRFNPSYIIAESNSIGEPIIEQLRRDGMRVRPFNTTNATKAEAIEALALAFERGDIRIIPDETLINELQAYELERLPSGAVRYSAPAGLHDDCVMSLAIVWNSTTKRAGYGFGG